VSFALGQSLELLRDAGVAADVVRLTGGGVRSALWRGVLADVFGCPVEVQAHDEGPAYGAALLAAVGGGAFASIEAAGHLITPSGKVSPREENAVVYREAYALYKELYEAIEPLYVKRQRLENLGHA
jgi:xylulokinase